MHSNDWDLPPPPGVPPVRPPRIWRLLLGILLLFGIFLASFFIPVPMFYAFLPGPVRDVGELLEVEDAETYSSEGQLLMTTVSVDTEVTVAEWIASAVDPDKQVILKENLTRGASLAELERVQKQEMTLSQQHAKEVALRELGIGRAQGDGAFVAATVTGTPGARVLKRGDVIISVGGEQTPTSCDVGRVIDEHEAGDEIRLRVRRNGRVRTFEVRLTSRTDDPASPLLGVSMRNLRYRFNPGFEIEFKTGEIAGPSAGLMMALTLYDRLTPDDLTGGRAVAGTGEIECDGGVTPIGGVEQKVAGAELEGADIFLAPVANAPAARHAADDIQVVAIEDFDDAVRFLETLE